MDKDTRSTIERATQRLRTLLEEDFAEQLYGDFDVDASGSWAEKAGRHLSPQRALQRGKILATLEHKRATGLSAADSVADYLRDAAFTTLNRFVALKMLEARELVQECVTRGEQSSGYREFCGLAPGVSLLPDSAGYRLYIESLFDELSTEVKVLFDRRDPASILWPKRVTFEQLLELLNAPELALVWREDETIGWVYQYFNGSDERRRMREESQAPRNSRELAVRNQFFTPRYVVQFLTDNTLGRIWYEMRSTQTVLAQRCEYLVRKPGETVTPREKKDPRDLRVLDPACGSGHFLLYAFELLVAIYEEAHADPASPRSEATGRAVREDYPTLEALHRALPALILAHNLYGIDIDARCAQIAQLALWMRAQRAYRDFGIKREDRPPIRRSNIVVAEPLVSDDRLTEEFVARLGDEALGRVFRELIEALKLAGDLGILLRVERLLARTSEFGQIDYLEPREARIRDALRRFVAEEGTRLTMSRRLFADDAVQGLGLLETAEKSFDVILMNPPFGAGSTRAKKEFERAYPKTKNDVYAAFVERGVELLGPRGRLGAVSSRTGFFLPSFQRWREELLLRFAPPVVFADLGDGVMDGAMVEAAAYCLEKTSDPISIITPFFRVIDQRDKATTLIQTIGNTAGTDDSRRFDVAPSCFADVPRSPFTYWVSEDIRRLFKRLRSFGTDRRTVHKGVATSDDFRFVRANWEINTSAGKRWRSFAKGGAFARYYSDIMLVVNWESNARELEAEILGKYPYLGTNANWLLHRETPYFRPGITWTYATTLPFSTRALPTDSLFGHGGPAIFAERDELSCLLALTNSSIFGFLVQMSVGLAAAGRKNYDIGIIERLPLGETSTECRQRLSTLARRAWSLNRTIDTKNETSRGFTLPLGINTRITELDRAVIAAELAQIQRQIDNCAFELYGVGPEDRTVIESGSRTAMKSGNDAAEASDDEEEADTDSETLGAGEQAALISWLVGVAFGRFDPRLATGERAVPPEPEPFDRLPIRSPGMWPEGEAPKDAPDILVDDEGHGADLTARVKQIAERVHWQSPENLRAWLAREFFPLHIKMYSKSRRKAPIYWQLATPSGSYSVWLYLHALTKDTLFRVQHEYAGPKLLHEQQRLESLRRQFGENPSRTERKQITEQESLVSELRAFLEEVARIAPLWKPNLDDGVLINFAPLWLLVPHCAAWQRELKSTWDALCDGKYDWAHLAMHLWPERVVRKCAQDRSLAIAHELEQVFWAENSEGKWVARQTPTRSIAELVRERTSSAVNAALASLLVVPVAQNGGRPRARRARSRGAV